MDSATLHYTASRGRTRREGYIIVRLGSSMPRPYVGPHIVSGATEALNAYWPELGITATRTSS